MRTRKAPVHAFAQGTVVTQVKEREVAAIERAQFDVAARARRDAEEAEAKAGHLGVLFQRTHKIEQSTELISSRLSDVERQLEELNAAVLGHTSRGSAVERRGLRGLK